MRKYQHGLANHVEHNGECLWFGDDGNNLFTFDSFRKRRVLTQAFYPLRFYNDKLQVPPLKMGERRVLSVDVALMASTKKKTNDAASIFLNMATQDSKVTYKSNIVYGEAFEGLTTDELGIIVMRYFYQYKCTDLVLDCNGKFCRPSQ